MRDNLRRENIATENEFLGVLFSPLLIQSYSSNPSLVPDVVCLCVSLLHLVNSAAQDGLDLFTLINNKDSVAWIHPAKATCYRKSLSIPVF